MNLRSFSHTHMYEFCTTVRVLFPSISFILINAHKNIIVLNYKYEYIQTFVYKHAGKSLFCLIDYKLCPNSNFLQISTTKRFGGSCSANQCGTKVMPLWKIVTDTSLSTSISARKSKHHLDVYRLQQE